jgi:hypothetical protein
MPPFGCPLLAQGQRVEGWIAWPSTFLGESMLLSESRDGLGEIDTKSSNGVGHSSLNGRPLIVLTADTGP